MNTYQLATMTTAGLVTFGPIMNRDNAERNRARLSMQGYMVYMVNAATFNERAS